MLDRCQHRHIMLDRCQHRHIMLDVGIGTPTKISKTFQSHASILKVVKQFVERPIDKRLPEQCEVF